MEAHNSSELWLVCSIQTSCTIISVHFDEDLWEKIFAIVKELYAEEKPKIPTKLHQDLKELCLCISSFTQTNCMLMCEVPTITGDHGNIYVDPNVSSPYCPNMQRNCNIPDLEHITEKNKSLQVECTSAFTACHEVLRTPARELLVFMLTNKDRKQHKQVPYSFPIAYAMKGPSMTNADLQFMVNLVCNKLEDKKIPVLREAYDGQWHNHITQNANGDHLMRMHGRTTWLNTTKMSKDKCIEKLSTY